MSHSFKTVEDYVIVDVDDQIRETSSGIALPEGDHNNACSGTVIAAGPGLVKDDGEEVKMYVEPGDRIIFGMFAGDDFKHRGAEYRRMRQREVLGILHDED